MFLLKKLLKRADEIYYLLFYLNDCNTSHMINLKLYTKCLIALELMCIGSSKCPFFSDICINHTCTMSQFSFYGLEGAN